jgi:protein dithiol:quinone oxidoreductase
VNARPDAGTDLRTWRGALQAIDHPRGLASLLVIGCFVALAIGLFVQHGLGYPPCSLCVLQRLAFIFVLLLTLPMALFGASPGVARMFAAPALIAALLGLGVAIYQVWMSAFPTEVARCGRGLAGYFEDLPFEDFANWVLAAEGDCGKPVRFFGVTLPQLGLFAFAVMTVAAVRLLALSLRRSPRA